MSDESEQWILDALNLVEKHIAAIREENYEDIVPLFTPRVQNEILNEDLFREAIELYKEVPIDIKAIDSDNFDLISQDEIILKMKNTDRDFCKVIRINNTWLIDNIYWDLSKIRPEKTSDTVENEATPAESTDIMDENEVVQIVDDSEVEEIIDESEDVEIIDENENEEASIPSEESENDNDENISQ